MSQRRYICPACGQKAGVTIIYGYPSAELIQQAERGEVVLGGCMQEIEDPDRQCLKCGRQWPIPSRTERLR